MGNKSIPIGFRLGWSVDQSWRSSGSYHHIEDLKFLFQFDIISRRYVFNFLRSRLFFVKYLKFYYTAECIYLEVDLFRSFAGLNSGMVKRHGNVRGLSSRLGSLGRLHSQGSSRYRGKTFLNKSIWVDNTLRDLSKICAFLERVYNRRVNVIIVGSQAVSHYLKKEYYQKSRSNLTWPYLSDRSFSRKPYFESGSQLFSILYTTRHNADLLGQYLCCYLYRSQKQHPFFMFVRSKLFRWSRFCSRRSFRFYRVLEGASVQIKGNYKRGRRNKRIFQRVGSLNNQGMLSLIRFSYFFTLNKKGSIGVKVSLRERG